MFPGKECPKNQHIPVEVRREWVCELSNEGSLMTLSSSSLLPSSLLPFFPSFSYFGLIGINCTFACQIGFISDQQLVHRLTCVTIDLRQPLFNVVEWHRVGDIIDDDDAMSTTIVRAGDCWMRGDEGKRGNENRLSIRSFSFFLSTSFNL
jgi:hypothetical protein